MKSQNANPRFSNPFRDFPREVGVLVFASFFVAIGFGIIAPTLPLYAKSFGINNAQVGSIITLFALARFASGLFSGKLVDRFGERVVYSTGLAFVSLSSLAAGLAQNFPQLLFFRAAGGLGSSMFSVAAGSIILRATDDTQRARAQSLYNGSFLVGMVAGPAVGGALSAFSLRAPLLIYSALTVVAAVACGTLLKDSALTAKPTQSEKKEVTSIRDAFALIPYQYALIINFCTGFILFGMGRSILPLFMVEDMHSSASFIGWGFTLSSVVQGAFILKAGKASDIRGRKFTALVGTSLLTASVFAIAFTTRPMMFFAAMFLSGLGAAYISTTPSSIVGDVLEGKGGQVIGIFQMSGDFGAVIAPIVLGALSDSAGFRPAFLLSAFVISIALGISTKLPETRASHLGQSR